MDISKKEDFGSELPEKVKVNFNALAKCDGKVFALTYL